MKFICCISIICFSFGFARAKTPCSCETDKTIAKPVGYYWRDYVGNIPDDAIPGGIDNAGNPTYIAQVYIRNFELLVGTIRAGFKSAIVSAYNRKMESDKNVKILCSNQLENFAWVVTNTEDSHLLTNCHLVVGGSEVDQILHIGRVNHDGQSVIGKVFSYRPGYKGLWIPTNGPEAHFKSYEVLTYNCNKQHSLYEPVV